MIKFTQERYAELKSAYLSKIETSQSHPAEFIASKMRRYEPIGEYTILFIRLMLLDEKDRDLLADFLVHIHYAETGKNILIETPKGYSGEDSATVARNLYEIIRERADKFTDYLIKNKKNEVHKINRKINKRQNETAKLKKEIKTLSAEINMLESQISKKRKTIESNERRIAELQEDIQNLKENITPKEKNDEQDSPR